MIRLVSIIVIALLLQGAGCTRQQQQPSPPTITASFGPATIDPGDRIGLTYTINYAGNWRNITGVTLAGLPPNSPTPKTLPVPIASGIPVTHPLTIQKPAIDGNHQLSIEVAWTPPQPATAVAGTLKVRDKPAAVNLVDMLPDRHRPAQDCQGVILLTRTFRYDVMDDNGAHDIYNVDVAVVSPEIISNTRPPFRLLQPTRSNQVMERVDTNVDVRCDVPIGSYDWTLAASEDDKVAGTPPRRTISEDVFYFVRE